MAAQARRIAELERQLAAARGRSTGGDGDGGNRGARGGPGGRGDGGGIAGTYIDGGFRGGGGGGSTRARPGDWACPNCSFFPCFGRSSTCFRCGARRAGGGAGGQRQGGAGDRPPWRGDRGTGGGPIGADGKRPLLGGRGAQLAAPRREGPPQATAAVASAAAAGPGMGRQAIATGPAPPGGAAAGGGWRLRVGGSANAALRASEAEDADGFRQVLGRGAAVAGGVAAAASPAAAAASAPPWRVAAAGTAEVGGDGDVSLEEVEEVDDDFSGDMAEGDWWGEDEEMEGGGIASAGTDEGGEQRSVAELRQEWDAAAEAVRVLERHGRRFPDRVIEAARMERDEAERAWRAARRPHPLHKRLRWAEAALNAAIAKQRANREEAEAYAAEVERQRERMARRAEEDDARVRKRRARLDELREEEVGESEAAGGGQQVDVGARAMHEAADGIASVAPRVAAIIEGITDIAAKEALQATLVTLTNVHGGLQSAAAAAGGGRIARPSWARTVPWAEEDEDRRAGWACRRPSPIVVAAAGVPAAPKTDGCTGSGGGGGAASARPRWSGVRGTEKSGGHPAAKRAAWADETEGTLIDTTSRPAEGSAAAGGELPASSAEAADRARQAVLRWDAEQAAKVAADAGAAAAAAQAAADAAAAELAGARADADRRADETIRQQQAKVAEAEERQREEERRQREQLIANMSDEERRRAETLHLQQQAVAASGFGTAGAVELAGRVFGARVMEVVDLVRANGVTADPQYLQALSPEKLEEYAALHSGAAFDSL